MQYIITKEAGESLDAIVYKNYGSSFGYLELVLQANYYLYRESVILKQGTTIELPEVKKEAQSRITLWN